MSKADAVMAMRLSGEDKARLQAEAKAAGMSLACYVRHRALAGEGGAAPAPQIEAYHVDDLGPDTLRAETRSLSR